MNFTKETTRKSVFTRFCHVLYDTDVQQGIGAVLVLVGFALTLSGVIFTIVAYSGSRSKVVGSFPYVGPILIVFGVLFVLHGYILSHKTEFKQLWFYFKRRKRQTYVEQEYCESEDINGSISAICLRVLVCMFVKRNTRTHSGGDACNHGNEENTGSRHGQSNADFTSTSFSPLRKCKVHPSVTESSV